MTTIHLNLSDSESEISSESSVIIEPIKYIDKQIKSDKQKTKYKIINVSQDRKTRSQTKDNRI